MSLTISLGPCLKDGEEAGGGAALLDCEDNLRSPFRKESTVTVLSKMTSPFAVT